MKAARVDHRALSLLLLPLITACPPEPFVIADAAAEDGGPMFDGGPGFDGGQRLDAGEDAGRTNPCDRGVRCTDGCPRPWLLAAQDDVVGSAMCQSRVLRWSLRPDGGLCSCDGIDVGGTGENRETLTAVGYLPGAGGSDGVVIAGTNRAIYGFGNPGFRYPLVDELSVLQPEEVVVVEDPDGTLRSGVILFPSTGSGTGLFFNERGADPVILAGTRSPGLFSRGDRHTQNPRNRQALRRSRINYPSGDVDPWNNETLDLEHFAQGGARPGVVKAFYFNGLHRTVITSDVGDEAVFSIAIATDEGGHIPPEASCTNEGFTDCRYAIAVPDPFSADQVYVTCAVEGYETSLLRMNVSTGECELVFDELRAARINDLFVALDNYWQ